MSKDTYIIVNGKRISFKVTKKDNPNFSYELAVAMFVNKGDSEVKASDKQLDEMASHYLNQFGCHHAG